MLMGISKVQTDSRGKERR